MPSDPSLILRKPRLCPECGKPAAHGKEVSGPWVDWNLYEAICIEGHYWAVDLTTKQRVAGLGYRMDRTTGQRKEVSALPPNYLEKWWASGGKYSTRSLIDRSHAWRGVKIDGPRPRR